jgi:hypothetical protein
MPSSSVSLPIGGADRKHSIAKALPSSSNAEAQLPIGSAVEYFSTSLGNKWIPAVVQGFQQGKYQLDIHSSADPSKVRAVPEVSMQGVWSKGEIEGKTLIWPSGRKTNLTDVSATCAKMIYEGVEFECKLEADGLLHWSDGDVWYREADRCPEGGESKDRQSTLVSTSNYAHREASAERSQLKKLASALAQDAKANPSGRQSLSREQEHLSGKASVSGLSTGPPSSSSRAASSTSTSSIPKGQLPDCQSTARKYFARRSSIRGIDLSDLERHSKGMARSLGVPETVFEGLKNQHSDFDFDGNGRLDEKELCKLLAMTVREHNKTVQSPDFDIPVKSLSRAGYTMVKVLGRGNQSVANLATDADGFRRCLKTFDKSRVDKHALEAIKEEYDLLKYCISAHPNIGSSRDVFQDEGFYYVVQDLYSGGDFTNLRERATAAGVSMTGHWWRSLFNQCFLGLAHLHENALIHCDIKESNMMIQRADYRWPEPVIIDFGLVQTAASTRSVCCGTAGYMPIEVWDTGKWHAAGDVFCMGVVMLQMVLNKIPPHHNPPAGAKILPGGIFTEGASTIEEVMETMRTKEPPVSSLPSELNGLGKLSRRLLHTNYESRPRASQVLRDPWFTDVSFAESLSAFFM